MPWGKMDDKFHRNKKVRLLRRTKAGRDALGVWVWWWSWCLDDPAHTGVVPADELLADEKRAAKLLVSAGLWEPTGDGFAFHDFHAWNPTKEQREKKQLADRIRQQTLRAKQKADLALDAENLAEKSGVSQRDIGDCHTRQTGVSHATNESVASPARTLSPALSRSPAPTHPILGDGATSPSPASLLIDRWADDSGQLAPSLSPKVVTACREIAAACPGGWLEPYERWRADPWVLEKQLGMPHLRENLHKYLTGKPSAPARLVPVNNHEQREADLKAASKKVQEGQKPWRPKQAQ